MREILFKAKDKDDGKWYEGYYWRTDDTTYCFEEDYERNPNNTHHYLLFDRMVDWGLPNRKLKADIDPDTLCQFTGLYDKNGKKIWENDIIRKPLRKSGEPETGVVFYDVENSAFTIRWIAPRPIFSPMFPHKHRIEQIGNIFDNPDLLTTSSTDSD